MSKYLLDTNVFIQAKNLHYGFEFCPAFWDWLDEAHATGTVASIDRVRDELIGSDDELAEWTKARDSFFMEPDALVMPELAAVSQWASSQKYEGAAVNTFLQVADYWLVAHAKAHGYEVVTHEVPAQSVKKIKIPNACVSLGIKCISPYEMLRKQRARFILGK